MGWKATLKAPKGRNTMQAVEFDSGQLQLSNSISISMHKTTVISRAGYSRLALACQTCKTIGMQKPIHLA